jgi:hypothetical protein
MNSAKIGIKQIETLITSENGGLAQALIGDPILLDHVMEALKQARSEVTEKAKAKFRLSKSYWPNFDTSREKSTYVYWVAHDIENHRAVEMMYDFRKREYEVKEQSEVTAEELKATLAMIYAILPLREIKMISDMQGRYDDMIVNQGSRTASRRR